jgi:mono/diheme cytochrome c family protein
LKSANYSGAGGITLMLKKYLPIVIPIAGFVIASSLFGQAFVPEKIQITPVQGESWLRHLRRPFNESSMGRTWQLGPAPPAPGQDAPQWQLNLSPAFSMPAVVVHGSDLYRMNCQGCHQDSGLGAPPEINSLIDPVRATSAATIAARMKAAGREADGAMVAELAKQSNTLLMQRLHEGGKSMPPPNLTEPEIRAVFAYLQQLAGVIGAEKKQIQLNESPNRIGEHIIKSTCHICHSAEGPNPDPQKVLDGAIPPLSSLTTRVSLSEFVRKVTSGAPILMGTPPLSYRDYYRGRMPVFSYLSQDEAAAAYFYLMRFPPRQ